MKGNPKTMQQSPSYNDIVIEIIQFLAERIKVAHEFGITDLIADPGFGFGKTTELWDGAAEKNSKCRKTL